MVVERFSFSFPDLVVLVLVLVLVLVVVLVVVLVPVVVLFLFFFLLSCLSLLLSCACCSYCSCRSSSSSPPSSFFHSLPLNQKIFPKRTYTLYTFSIYDHLISHSCILFSPTYSTYNLSAIQLQFKFFRVKLYSSFP